MPSQQLKQAKLYSIYRISYYSLDQAANAKSAAEAGKIILYIQNMPSQQLEQAKLYSIYRICQVSSWSRQNYTLYTEYPIIH
jgi:hypothetical protein